MYIKNIEKIQQIKPGFRRASLLLGKNMIMLFEAKKGVLLDKHKHRHLQFGYCFSGTFDFNVNNFVKKVKNDESYLINGNVFHSAIACTDYYSVDIKVLKDNFNSDIEDISYNIMKLLKSSSEYDVNFFEFDVYKIYQIKTKKNNVSISLDFWRNREGFLFVNENVYINFDEQKILLEKMKIYSVKDIDCKILKIISNNTVLFLIDL